MRFERMRRANFVKINKLSHVTGWGGGSVWAKIDFFFEEMENNLLFQLLLPILFYVVQRRS